MRNYLRVIILLFFTGLPVIAISAEHEVMLEEVLVRVLKNNPALKYDQLSSLAAAKRIESAIQSQPFNLNLTVENFAGSNSYEDDAKKETILSLSKVLEMGSKAEHRGNVARSQYNMMLNEQDMKRLDVLAEATRRFIHVVVDQHRLNIAKEKVALVERSYRVIKKRVNAGRSPRGELRRISITRARTGVELEHAEHELKTSRLKLAVTWGETRTDFSSAKADLFALTSPVAFSSLEQQLERNPELIRLANNQRLLEAQLNLVRSKRSPDIELSAGVRQFKETNDDAFIFSATVPFGLNSRAEAGIESQRLLNEQVPYDQQKQKLALYESLYTVYQELLHSYEAVKVYRGKIIPEAEKALLDYEKGYARGRYSFLELKDAQTTLLNARLQAVISAENYHRYKIEIDRLTGAGLDKGV